MLHGVSKNFRRCNKAFETKFRSNSNTKNVLAFNNILRLSKMSFGFINCLLTPYFQTTMRILENNSSEDVENVVFYKKNK